MGVTRATWPRHRAAATFGGNLRVPVMPVFCRRIGALFTRPSTSQLQMKRAWRACSGALSAWPTLMLILRFGRSRPSLRNSSSRRPEVYGAPHWHEHAQR